MQDIFAWLTCESLPSIGLTAGNHTFVIGRSYGSNLVLPHPAVSKRHAALQIRGRLVILRDLDSSNGTFVNGKRVQICILQYGDLIEINPFHMRLVEKQERESDCVETQEISTRIFLAESSVSMAGKLEPDALTELLQSIEFNQKTCTLYVEGPQEGKAIFAQGRPILATFGGKMGVEAIISMLKIKSGRFSMTTKIEPAESNINCSVTSILLEASRRSDEFDTKTIES